MAQFTPPFDERGAHSAQERLQMLLCEQIAFYLQGQLPEPGLVAHGLYSVFVTRREALFQIAQAVRGSCRQMNAQVGREAVIQAIDPSCLAAFERLLAIPDPPEMPRRAHMRPYGGDPERRRTRLPLILMSWLQRRHMERDRDDQPVH